MYQNPLFVESLRLKIYDEKHSIPICSWWLAQQGWSHLQHWNPLILLWNSSSSCLFTGKMWLTFEAARDCCCCRCLLLRKVSNQWPWKRLPAHDKMMNVIPVLNILWTIPRYWNTDFCTFVKKEISRINIWLFSGIYSNPVSGSLNFLGKMIIFNITGVNSILQ